MFNGYRVFELAKLCELCNGKGWRNIIINTGTSSTVTTKTCEKCSGNGLLNQETVYLKEITIGTGQF
jgi:DnaJ-class molecular chaperone